VHIALTCFPSLSNARRYRHWSFPLPWNGLAVGLSSGKFKALILGVKDKQVVSSVRFCFTNEVREYSGYPSISWSRSLPFSSPGPPPLRVTARTSLLSNPSPRRLAGLVPSLPLNLPNPYSPTPTSSTYSHWTKGCTSRTSLPPPSLPHGQEHCRCAPCQCLPTPNSALSQRLCRSFLWV
jgi:hypothetical protein